MVDTTTTSNPIYHYRASDDLGEEAWGTLRDAVMGYVSGSLRSFIWDDIKEQFKSWEDEFKVSTGLPIPGAYRSAKSVLKNAIVLGLPFAGSPKTALEKLIKDKKAADKDVLTPQEKLDKMAQRANAYAQQNNLGFRAETRTIIVESNFSHTL